MRKILLIGKNGQVGWELQRTLATLGEVVAVGRQVLDLADPDAIRRIIREVRPNLIVNAAAYTAVDKAESEPKLAMAINGVAPGIMAEESRRLGAALVHYSTDYVFDGTKDSPYKEADIPNPLNVYGKTKLAGEQAIQAGGIPHLILRTSWVYGARGRNFLLTILRLAKERNELKVVADQFGAPTWSRLIAEATGQVLSQLFSPLGPGAAALGERSGIYHLTAQGQTSWHGFAKAALSHTPAADLRLGPERVVSICTTEYPLPARRPHNSMLANDLLARTFGIALPPWEDSLCLCIQEVA